MCCRDNIATRRMATPKWNSSKFTLTSLSWLLFYLFHLPFRPKTLDRSIDFMPRCVASRQDQHHHRQHRQRRHQHHHQYQHQQRRILHVWLVVVFTVCCRHQGLLSLPRMSSFFTLPFSGSFCFVFLHLSLLLLLVASMTSPARWCGG